MAIGTVTTIGPKFTITPPSDGLKVIVAYTPAQFEVGGVQIDFVPDGAWNGSVTILSRSMIPDAITDDIAPVEAPYRALYLNGVPSDGGMQVGGTAITDRSRVLIPSSGQQVVLQLACSAGAMSVYTQGVVGATTP